MTRLPNWPELLAHYLDARRFMPFAIGSNDCCLFAADGVLAYTGVDIADGKRTYKTEKGAARIIARAGGMAQLPLAAGLPEIAIGFAQRGDLLLAENEGRELFALNAGNGSWCAPGADRLVFRPLREALRAFRV